MANVYSDYDYSQLVDKYKDLAFNIALKITRNEQDSEEIVQDSFLKAFSGLEKFKKESEFSTWFYRIVYNTAISSLRGKKYNSVEIDDKITQKFESDKVENAIQMLANNDRKQLISTAMAKLNGLDYTLLSLYYYEDLSLKEISKIVKKKPNYLKVLLQRARIKLYNSLSTLVKNELKELI